jgi:hypothetical protein
VKTAEENAKKATAGEMVLDATGKLVPSPLSDPNAPFGYIKDAVSGLFTPAKTADEAKNAAVSVANEAVSSAKSLFSSLKSLFGGAVSAIGGGISSIRDALKKKKELLKAAREAAAAAAALKQ